jgi:hypothetical protein
MAVWLRFPLEISEVVLVPPEQLVELEPPTLPEAIDVKPPVGREPPLLSEVRVTVRVELEPSPIFPTENVAEPPVGREPPLLSEVRVPTYWRLYINNLRR